jgi:Tfp pilus assembly protein PilF
VLRIVVLLAAALDPLQQAYDALHEKQYDLAVARFHEAISAHPDRASIHKDLAYALLKTGENVAARDQFAEAMRLDPADLHVAMEYAFLCFETKEPVIARRVFDRVRKTGDAVAEEAFQNIDKPLAEGIARWKKAIEMSPGNFSAHQELAMLAEQRDELELAAEQYEEAWRLRPGERGLMLDLGRVWKTLGRTEEAMFILLAASRGGQPRVAEKARELLPARYPYVYEFENALAIDLKNFDLRREFSYLLLEMGNKEQAEKQFQLLNQIAPADLMTAAQLGFLRINRGESAAAQPLFDQVLKGDDEELADRVRAALKLPQTMRRRAATAQRTSIEARDMAEKSLKAGYLKDALKYLTIAHENDPLNFEVMLKIGWVYNVTKDDKEAVKWFNLARKSPDSPISAEAGQAYQNLEPEFAKFRTTAWIFPFFSSRWHDVFSYGQVKTELKLGNFPLRPYLSVRLIGDLRGTAGATLSNPQPQYLSEGSFIFGAGVATVPKRGFTGWMEAGEAVKYQTSRKDVGAMIPDYRGGVSYAKGFGHMLNGGKGVFAETNDDAVFVSRFQDDLLFYSQNRAGYTFAGGKAQGYWNFDATVDRLGQYWANYADTGPGVRFRVEPLPKSMYFTVSYLRGVYLVNQDNPHRPNFWELRAGFWYAFTR